MSKEQADQSANGADEPTAVIPAPIAPTSSDDDATAVPAAPPAPVVPPAPPLPPLEASSAEAPPEGAPRDRRVSRGWLIAAAAAGGLIVLGLTFGGGIATGLVIGDHAGSSADRGGPGMHGPTGNQSGDDRGQQRP